MERATISQIKNRLSAYLKKVRAGLVHRAGAPLDVDVLRRGAPQSSVSVLEALKDNRRHDR